MHKDFEDYKAAVGDGMPRWAERELSSDYIKKPEKARQRRAGIDLPFLVLTFIILMIGVVMVLSASFARAYVMTGDPLRFFSRQIVFALAGVVVMMVVSRISISFWRRWSMVLLWGSIGLLVFVLVFGVTVNGATRWIDLGFTRIQPSEIAKLGLIMGFSRMICKFDKKMKSAAFGVVPFVMFAGVIILLLMGQPHLSASVIIIMQTAIMMFAGGAHLKWFVMPIVIIIAVAGFVFMSMLPAPEGDVPGPAPQQTVQQQRRGGRFSHALTRLESWRNPEDDPQGAGFQARQSLYAIGSGGLFGVGLGQSRQKHLYLPEEHNDYIFAIVAEELGFIGAVMILLLFVLLIVRGFWIALHARDRFSSLVVTGITALLAIQVFLNVAVVTNLVPATGIPLPFFSYGGTALMIQLVQMGIVLAVSKDIPLTRAG